MRSSKWRQEPVPRVRNEILFLEKEETMSHHTDLSLVSVHELCELPKTFSTCLHVAPSRFSRAANTLPRVSGKSLRSRQGKGLTISIVEMKPCSRPSRGSREIYEGTDEPTYEKCDE
jgi:hypothetical protein